MDEHGEEFRIDVLFDVHAGLPRQGPGDTASTRRALAACTGLPADPAIVDFGCGPGAQTLVLAAETHGRVVAIDLWPAFLRELAARAARAGTAGRILPVVSDMEGPPVADRAFDLVWAEAAAYAIGVPQALSAWRRHLRPGGWIAVSELVWLTDDPPADLAAFWAREYPGMGPRAAAEAAVAAAGYGLAESFLLPEDAWWRDYYDPLAARLPAAEARWASDAGALALIAQTRREIEMRRRYPDAYGYLFLVGRLPD